MMFKKWTVAVVGAVVAFAAQGAQGEATIFPKVFVADTVAPLTIGLPEMKADDAAKYRVLYIREDGAFTDGSQGGTGRFEVMKPTVDEAAKTLALPDVKLRGEGLHTMRIALDDGTTDIVKWKVVDKVQVYSLGEDLFKLRPYKGDFHAHSKEGSDGVGTAASVYAYGRRGGQDFQTLSDHSTYGASVNGTRIINKLNSGLLCLRGEELHAPNTPLHCLSIDADKGVASWTRANKEKFEEMVAEKSKEINVAGLSDYDRRGVAAAEVTFELARDNGAKLVIYCHPYWMPNDRYNASSGYNKAVIDRMNFDAIECPNGPDVQQTMMVVADKARLAEHGKKMSVVGVTDSHNAPTQTFNDRCTVAFAPELTAEAIAEAVKNCRSVAVVGKHGEKGEKPLIVGDDRLVRFCYFLSKAYYPAHDEICRQQGELMLKVLDGDESPATLEAIATTRQTLETYTAKVWGQ